LGRIHSRGVIVKGLDGTPKLTEQSLPFSAQLITKAEAAAKPNVAVNAVVSRNTTAK